MDYKEKVIALLNSQELSKEQKEKLENIFPELKESEDDKLKEQVVYAINQLHVCECTKNKLISWLEKQGEQKLSETTDLRTWKYIVDAVLTEREGIGQYIDSPWTTDVAEKLQKRFGNIEQKPVEWSADDNRRVLECIGSREFHLCEIGKDDDLEHVPCVLWLNSLKDRVQPQQKQEWSEADENTLLDTINTLRSCGRCSTDRALWLMSLKERCCPQSQWKPSDEQLKSLQEVIDVGYFASYPNSLETLYEQLKKLREE